MVAGLILGWLWLRAESIWLVANAHGALNNWGQYAVTYMKEFVTPDTDMAVLGAVSQALLVVRNSSAFGAVSHRGSKVGGMSAYIGRRTRVAEIG
jgi:hypothetical protein